GHLLRRRGRPAAPGDELQTVGGADGGAARSAAGGDGHQRGPSGGGRADLREAQGVRRLRLPGVARVLLRLPGLRQRLAEGAPPGGVLRRAAGRPADWVLLTVDAGGRCQQTWAGWSTI